MTVKLLFTPECKIAAIKLVRSLIRLDLKDAKDFVEGLIESHVEFPCPLESLDSQQLGWYNEIVFLAPSSLYSIEPHGEEGTYALYQGRSAVTHGMRLCNLSDFDHTGAKLRDFLVDCLNRGIK